MSVRIAFLLSALAASALASPTLNDIQKRAPSPKVGSNWNLQEAKQLNDAFDDALQLANNVLSTPSSIANPIMGKYFNPGDFGTVNQLFRQIAGDGTGNDLLQYITVIGDYPDDEGVLTCRTLADTAELRFTESGSPTMVLCDAAFEHGGINRAYNVLPLYPNPVSAVTCQSIGDQTSFKMDTLGATILHEYFHFLKLVAPPLAEQATDLAYGAYNTQTKLDKANALKNADSYTWMATELLWTVLCQKTYEDPTPPSSFDPLCGLTDCIRR